MQSVSSRNVGPGVYGTEDLDTAGTWSSVPEYGNVWHPNVGPDWAPYQSGRWVWEDWYGWTWVSYDPWGWAPYHYGRWFHQQSHRLVLVSRLDRCAALLVARVGRLLRLRRRRRHRLRLWQRRLGSLAPFEVFHPWWGRGFYGQAGFNRSINITNVNITNVYRNAQFRNGISAVAAHDFQSGRFNNVIRTSGAQVGSVGVIRGQMPFTAGSQNLRFSDRQATAIPRGNQNARFFTQQQPNPVQRGQVEPRRSPDNTASRFDRHNRGRAARRTAMPAVGAASGRPPAKPPAGREISPP